MKQVVTAKKQLLNEFSVTLCDFWGEEPTKETIQEAWEDYLDTVRESEQVPESYYTLTKRERAMLYREAQIA